ncbi:hypothetical protein B9G55_08935 [Saccharibacillus sp. O16]|nr:hypothetical protein B9G55_08935 [Saccharibacillus sp. O16]
MRLVLGAIFLAHGISKLQSGMDLMADWFSSVGLPGFLAYMVAMLELVCGTLMVLGVLTRSAAIGFIVVMIGAIVTVKLPAGLLGSNGSPGYELDLALMALAAYFAASKETGFGIDSLLAERDRQEDARLHAAAAPSAFDALSPLNSSPTVPGDILRKREVPPHNRTSYSINSVNTEPVTADSRRAASASKTSKPTSAASTATKRAPFKPSMT